MAFYRSFYSLIDSTIELYLFFNSGSNKFCRRDIGSDSSRTLIEYDDLGICREGDEQAANGGFTSCVSTIENDTAKGMDAHLDSATKSRPSN